MKCANCDWEYPDELLHSLYIDGANTPPICGLCANDMVTEIHGTPLHAPIALEFMRRAKEWRKEHPECQPLKMN